jgi:hypothetical protein
MAGHRKKRGWRELLSALRRQPDDIELRRAVGAQVRLINRPRGMSPEDAEWFLAQGLLSREQADLAVEMRKGAEEFETYFALEAVSRGLRPGGGRPKKQVNRDGLIACLRDCCQMEYEQPRPPRPSIREVVEAVGLTLPAPGKARDAAVGRGRRARQGEACDHRDLLLLFAAIEGK